MALDGNYSTLNRANSYFSFQEGISSRILVGISAGNYAAGITAGDVIRWDTTSQQYEKSKANTPYTAEVFGIVESYSDGDLYVVVNGSINLNPDKTILRSGDNTGGNDVFFLSGNNLGFIENVGSTFAGYVIKPIYQVAPHGNFTGIVRNYLGYRTNVSLNTDPDVFGEIISFSDDMSRMISYSPISQTFYINTLSYSNDIFTRTTVESFSKNDVPPVTFLLDNTHDCKVSNNGKDVLIFSKFDNKIYYINLDTGSPILKQTLSLDVVGSVEDKIWACDDELSSFTISSKSLTRQENSFDTKMTTNNISSKIYYYRRNMNSRTPYKWILCHTNHASGHVSSIPREYLTGFTDHNDSINLLPGVFRSNDIKCKGKNYSSSTLSLIQDQIDYKSKITGYNSQRYLQDQFLNITSGITIQYLYDLSPAGITIEGFTLTNNVFAAVPLLNNLTSSFDNESNKKYKCSSSLRTFRINNKINNYYYEDGTFRDNGFAYSYPFDSADSNYSISLYTAQGLTFSQSISDLLKLVEGSVTFVAFAGIPTSTPTYQQEILCSRTSLTQSNVLYCLLYKFYSNTQTIGRLVLIKFPLLAKDNINLFKNYSISTVTNSIVPNNGENYGLINSFYTTLGTEVSSQYINVPVESKEVFTTSSDSLITEINIDFLNNFNLYTSDTNYFICLSDKTLVWNYQNKTYVIINTENFDKAYFYNNSNGEFFVVQDKIFKYNQSNNSFIEQTIN